MILNVHRAANGEKKTSDTCDEPRQKNIFVFIFRCCCLICSLRFQSHIALTLPKRVNFVNFEVIHTQAATSITEKKMFLRLYYAAAQQQMSEITNRKIKKHR